MHFVPADARGLCTGAEEAAGSRGTAAANEKVTQHLRAYNSQAPAVALGQEGIAAGGNMQCLCSAASSTIPAAAMCITSN
jgi:hypothetical protein